MCSRGVLVITERAVRALDGRGSEGWDESTVNVVERDLVGHICSSSQR